MTSPEFFQTYDNSGHPLTLVARTEVHARGLWHRAVNVFLFRTDGRLLLQRRAAGKDVCPGAWDLSVAEHLQPGESYIDAAHRGLAEELCVSGVALHALGAEQQFRYEDPTQDIKDYEWHQCFTGVSDAPVTLDKREVSATRLLTTTELRQQIEDEPAAFTPWLRQLLPLASGFANQMHHPGDCPGD